MTDSNQPQNEKPVQTVRDGKLKIAIWRRQGSNGMFYSISAPTRSYQDQNNEWQETTSLSGAEILMAAKLLEEAYSCIKQLRQADKQQQQEAA